MAKKMMRISIVFLIFSALLFVFASNFSLETGAAEEVFKMKIGTVVPATSAWGKVAKRYETDTEKVCEGKLEIELILGGQLGNEAKMVELVMKGDLQAAAVTSGAVARVVPELNILDVPYLFRDVDEARMINDNVIAPLLVRKLSGKKLFGTAMFDSGFRDFIAVKFIKKPSDLSGLKVASDDTDIQMAFWKALGVSAMPTPMDKLQTVLRKGDANCADNSIMGIYALNLYLKQKYITESEHTYQAAMVVLNNDWWESLPVDLKLRMLKQNAKLVSEMRVATKTEIANVRRGMEPSGVKFYKLTDAERESFVKLTAPVLTQFQSRFGKSLVDKVLEARTTYRKMKAAGKSDEEIEEKIKIKL